MKYLGVMACIVLSITLTGCLVSKEPLIGGDAIITPTKGGLYEKCDYAKDSKEYYACDYVTVGVGSGGTYAATNIFSTSSEVFSLGRLQDTSKWAIQYSAGAGEYQYGMAQQTHDGLLAIFPQCNAIKWEIVNDYGNRGYITHAERGQCYIRDLSALVQMFKELPERTGSAWLEGAQIKKLTPLTNAAALQRAADKGFKRFKETDKTWFISVRNGALFLARFPGDRRAPEAKKMLQYALQQDELAPYRNDKGKILRASTLDRGLAMAVLGDVDAGFSLAINTMPDEHHQADYASQVVSLIIQHAFRLNHPKRSDYVRNACDALLSTLQKQEVVSDPAKYVSVDVVRQQLACGKA